MSRLDCIHLIVQHITTWITIAILLLGGLIADAQAGIMLHGKLIELRGTDGKSIQLKPAEITVLCFLGTECPLAKLYGARLQTLADTYADQGVVFVGVNSNMQDSPAEINAYVKKHGIEFSIAKDADQSVADALNATRTPEVFVLDARGLVQYQGRIDDQYAPGVARAKPTQHDLRDAIECLLDGKPVANSKTEGVGCLITRVTKTELRVAATVTFHRDIVPILNEHCVECHREGEIGPMELTDYNEVVGWGQMILEVIDEQRMPPWHADPNIGHFIGERTFPQNARDKIKAWVDEGMPEGDPASAPKRTTWASGWHLHSEPDIEIAMRDRPFVVPADGVVEYQYFVVDPQWSEDRWISAAQVVPGNAEVVHHAIVFVRPPDGSGDQGIGWLGAYVPGQRSVMLPAGHARRVPAGSKLVFQMHYTPNGQVTEEITRVGVWEVPAGEVTHEVMTQLAINHEFEIPPGSGDYEVEMTVDSFPPNSKMLGITPHMHLRGKSFVADAKLEDGKRKPLLSVPRYDFNWQHWYAFAEPVDLESVDSLSMTVTFDNSVANPFNPAPDEFVAWGDQTWEEMAVAFFDVAIPRGGEKYRADRRAPFTKQQREDRAKKIDDYVKSFLAELDKDGDGVVLRDETPIAFRRFGFRRLDRNGDGRIERQELKRSAAQRL